MRPTSKQLSVAGTSQVSVRGTTSWTELRMSLRKTSIMMPLTKREKMRRTLNLISIESSAVFTDQHTLHQRPRVMAGNVFRYSSVVVAGV